MPFKIIRKSFSPNFNFTYSFFIFFNSNALQDTNIPAIKKGPEFKNPGLKKFASGNYSGSFPSGLGF